MFRWLVIIALVILGCYVFFDHPAKSVRDMAGALMGEEEIAPRGAAQPVAIALIPDQRRQGRRVARLLDDWFYCHTPSGEIYRVRQGFETDFASVPTWQHWYVSPFGNHTEAAIVHDWLYAVGEPERRDFADDVFRYAMGDQGVNIVRRNIMWATVRVFGGKGYGESDQWTFADLPPKPLSPGDEAWPPVKPIRAAEEIMPGCTGLAERFGGGGVAEATSADIIWEGR